MAYTDCKFYERLNDMADGLIGTRDGEIELDRKSLDILDEELGGAGGDWLAYHYEGSAEYLAEAAADGLALDADMIGELVTSAMREIEIFRKHGYNEQADRMAGYLADAVCIMA